MSRLRTLKNLLENKEWILVYPNGKQVLLKDFEIEERFGKIIFTFSDNDAFSVWRIESFEPEGEKILLAASRNFGREKLALTLAPAKLESSLEAEIRKIAELFTEKIKLKIKRLKLYSKHIAKVFFEQRENQHVLLIGLDESVEKLLTKAILEKRRWENRKISVAVYDQVEKLQALYSLLRDYWKDQISIYKISSELKIEKIDSSVSIKPAKISFAKKREINRLIRNFFDEERMQVLPLKNEELICFLGLPFASIRDGKIWFGVEEDKRKLLTQENYFELCDLIKTLKDYRCFNSLNKRHEFYRLMPEKWLEFVLRKNIKLLDSELALSPVYEQLSLDKERIDLLAVRQDGRLVVIELKISESCELLFQALNYWWKIENARQSGTLNKIFPGFEVYKKRPIIYLVSPILSFHKDLDFLASTIIPEVEIFRLGLNQDWRREIRVLEKRKM